MSEWKEVRLGDYCDLIAGYAFKSKDFGNYPTKVLKIADINPPFVSSQNSSGVDLSKYDVSKLEKFVVTKGDYVLAMTGATIGKLGRFTSEEKAYLNQRVLKFKPHNSIDSNFLYYILCGRLFAKYVINHIDSESAQPNISAGTIGKFSFCLPDLNTQCNISSILTALDDKIAVNRRICENLEAQAQALFKHWFIDFAPFKNGKFVESELGMIPEGWRVGTLGELAEISSGKRPKSRYNNQTKEHNIPLIGASCIMGYTDDIFTSNRILLTGRVGTLGVVQRFNSACWPSDNTLVLSTNFYEFVYQTIKTVNYSAMNRGTSQPLITQGDLKKTLITIPSNSILNKYEEVAGGIMSYIDFHFKESSRLSTLRDTLLPKLMSGQIKV